MAPGRGGGVMSVANQMIANKIPPANTSLSTKVGSMLGQRRRRWPNIEPTLGWVKISCLPGCHHTSRQYGRGTKSCGSMTSYCYVIVNGCERVIRGKAKSGNCLHYKWAVTAVCLCTAARAGEVRRASVKQSRRLPGVTPEAARSDPGGAKSRRAVR